MMYPQLPGREPVQAERRPSLGRYPWLSDPNDDLYGPGDSVDAGAGVCAVVVPQDVRSPVQVHRIPGVPLEAEQRLVPGLVEGVALTQPPALMYLSGERVRRSMPENVRAGILAQAHRPTRTGYLSRTRRRIAGPAVIVGPPDLQGRVTNAPADLLAAFAHGGPFSVTAATNSRQGMPFRDGVIFDDVFAAYQWGLDLVGMGRTVNALQITPAAVMTPSGQEEQHHG